MMKMLLKILFLFVVCSTLMYCSKDDAPPVQVPMAEESEPAEPAATPTLTGMVPEQGKNGIEVTLNGTDFGTDISSVSVTFNGVEAAVQSVNNTSIIVTVPDNAGNGAVQLAIGGNVLNGPVFIYQNPIISGISPNNGPKTTIVTINGSHFGEDISNVKVYFNEEEGEVLSVTENNILAKVPPKAFSGQVTISVDGTSIEGPNFEYILTDVRVTTIVGSINGYLDGPGDIALMSTPVGITIDSEGNLFVSATSIIRKIDRENNVTTLAGALSSTTFADGPVDIARFDNQEGLVIDPQGNMYVADTQNHKIRKITPSGIVSTLAGSTSGFADGNREDAQFSAPTDITIDSRNNLYVTDLGNRKVRKITPNGDVTTFAGSVIGEADGTGTDAQFMFPRGITIDSDNNLYVGDLHRIRKISDEGVVVTVAGSSEGFADGNAENALFGFVNGLAVDESKNLYVLDAQNAKVRKITSNGIVSTLAGSENGFVDGSGTTAMFNQPRDIVIGPDRTLYVADLVNNRIRKITQE